MTDTWGNKQESIEDSEFFEGNTLFKKMKGSLYGLVWKIFNDVLSDDEKSTYRLPRVVVIGDESTGKSSLLEGITKCKMFPRDNKMCTKFPIRVKLSTGEPQYSVSYMDSDGDRVVVDVDDKNEIYPIIKELMSKIPGDQISENEIIVRISEPNVPTFELLDLPGIRTYPLETAKTIKRLCRKNLKDINTICLCVVPAITTRITAQQSIAMVSQYGAGSRCILALTMADKVISSDIDDLLIKRLIGTSDEFTGLNFAGCVAVANRTHLDSISMKDQDVWERKWFEQNVINKISSDDQVHKQTIVKNVTICNLINVMDKMYCNFIRTVWRPNIEKTIATKLKRLNMQLTSLGNANVDVDAMNRLIEQKLRAIFNDYDYIDAVPDSDEVLPQHRYIVPRSAEEKKRLSIEFTYDKKVERCNEYEQYIIQICDTLCRDDIHDLLYDSIDNIFIQPSKHMLNRFDKVKQLLKQTIKNNLQANVIRNKARILNIAINKLDNEFVDDNTLENINKPTFRLMMDNLFNRHVLYPSLIFPIQYTQEDYVENDRCALIRSNLELDIKKCKIHQRTIARMCENVENQLNIDPDNESDAKSTDSTDTKSIDSTDSSPMSQPSPTEDSSLSCPQHSSILIPISVSSEDYLSNPK